MLKKIQILFGIAGIIMVFTAQTYRSHEPTANVPARTTASRPAGNNHVQTRPAAQPQARPMFQGQGTAQRPPYNGQNRQVVQFHKEPAAPSVVRNTPTIRQMPIRPVEVRPQYQQPSTRKPWTESRIYAAPPAAVGQNDRAFHRHHHNNWQPRYNFYENQYHFYPYVDIAALVELTSDSVMLAFGGQNYCYDQGTFYIQDDSGQYVAVPPPLGIIVNPLPANAYEVDVNGQVYYRYKGVFYIQVEQGYQVVGPVGPVTADT
jgi:hypothetical protein